MAKLILTLNENIVGEFPLNKECVTIGRKPDNDIQIDNLAVSGHHAQIITILNDSFLEDLNSTNGTYVNSKLIKKHALSDGDVISLGKHQLKYVNELSRREEETEDFERTMIIRPDAAGMPTNEGDDQLSEESVGKLKAEHAESVKATEASSAPIQKAKLQILSGANTGKELELGLVDVSPEALAVAEGLVAKMVEAKGAPVRVVASTDRREILAGEHDLRSLSERVRNGSFDLQPVSGRQEWLENLVSRYL